MTAAPRYRARSVLHAVDLDGEVLIWDADREHLHRLNTSASRIWDALGEWRTVDEVAGSLGRERAPRVARDVAACIADFEEMGLVERESG